MKYIMFILVLLISTTTQAQSFEELFPGNFRGLQTSITHTNDSGEVVTELYTTKFGIFSRKAEAISINGPLVGNGSVQDIPTVGLAFEHWWLSFELLMKGQREYGDCIGSIKEIQRLTGKTCLIDDECSPLHPSIMNLREYWVPGGAFFNSADINKPPRRQDYIDHFVAGLSGLNMIIVHRDSCRNYLDFLRESTFGIK